MSIKTQIEWTNATWNPVRGCSRVSEGCRNCYAEVQAARVNACQHGSGIPEGSAAYDGLLAKSGQWNGKIKLVPQALQQPLSWKEPRRIFVNSMSDLFHENVPDEFISQVFEIMALCPQHTFQILTKRPERMLNYFMCMSLAGAPERLFAAAAGRWPLPNVWLGVSVEDQKTADARIPVLFKVPAAIRWVSIEPLLGSIDLERGGWSLLKPLKSPPKRGIEGSLDWVVVGGESGANARPMHPDWVRGLRDQCAAAGVPFFFKQWGEWAPEPAISIDNSPFSRTFFNNAQMTIGEKGERIYRVGKKRTGRLLDGAVYAEYPTAKEGSHAN